MDYQAKLRKKLERGKIKILFPDQINKKTFIGGYVLINCNGFYQINNLNEIGYGLDYGYRLLPYVKKPNNMSFETRIAACVEKVVGKRQMRGYFDKSNLSALVSELGQYSDYDDALLFIKTVDMLSDSLKSDSIFKKKSKTPLYIKGVNEFLIEIVSNKVSHDRLSGKMKPYDSDVFVAECAELIDPKNISAISSKIDRNVFNTVCGKSYTK